MNRIFLRTILTISILIPLLACGERIDYIEDPSGLKYFDKVVGNGDSPRNGDRVTVHYTGWLDSNDEKFDSSVDKNRPFSFVLGQGRVIKGWDIGVSTMKKGGKRLLLIPSELAYGKRGAGQRIPPDSTLRFEVELLDIQRTPEQWSDESKKVNTTRSGLKYIVYEPGEGKSPRKGAEVSVHYSGFLEDGKMFDSSHMRGKPIRFPLGQGRVIKGWDEGIALMKPGAKYKLIIPAALGYGARGAGQIPANASLFFDVELVEVHK